MHGKFKANGTRNKKTRKQITKQILGKKKDKFSYKNRPKGSKNKTSQNGANLAYYKPCKRIR